MLSSMRWKLKNISGASAVHIDQEILQIRVQGSSDEGLENSESKFDTTSHRDISAESQHFDPVALPRDPETFGVSKTRRYTLISPPKYRARSFRLHVVSTTV